MQGAAELAAVKATLAAECRAEARVADAAKQFKREYVAEARRQREEEDQEEGED